MKCGILTFSFAYNYGALLQAMSLKSFLEKKGCETNVISYAPKQILNGYSLNPFVGSWSIKSVVFNLLHLPFRVLQYRLFDQFVWRLHEGRRIFSNIEKLSDIEQEYDALIVGSDQVWNDSITGVSEVYYLPNVGDKILKISYAACFGKKNLSDYQKKCISKYLPDFSSLSLREEDGKEDLETCLKRKIKIVLDPVFLTNKEEWAEISNNSRIRALKRKYLLYYSLSFCTELANQANEIAKKLNLSILSIHPTAKRYKVKGKQLFNVGPYEFLWLIKNAEIICTDSFHATAFSVIFKKKLVHIIKKDRESRVESLLNRINAYEITSAQEKRGEIMDFSMIDNKKLDSLIEESKMYLHDALNLKG